MPRAQIQMEIGMILERKGKAAEARRTYQDVAQTFPDGSWSAKARERLRLIDDQMKTSL